MFEAQFLFPIIKALVTMVENHIYNVNLYGEKNCSYFQNKFNEFKKVNESDGIYSKEMVQYFDNIVPLYGEICTIRELIKAGIDANCIEIIKESKSKKTPDIKVNNPGRKNSYIEVCTPVWQDFDEPDFDDGKLLRKIIQKKSFIQHQDRLNDTQFIFYHLIGRMNIKHWQDIKYFINCVDSNPLDFIDNSQIALSFVPEPNQHVIIFSPPIVEGLGEIIIWINKGMEFVEISITELKELIQNSSS